MVNIALVMLLAMFLTMLLAMLLGMLLVMLFKVKLLNSAHWNDNMRKTNLIESINHTLLILMILDILIFYISLSYLNEGINAQQCSDTDYVRAIYEASDLVWARYPSVTYRYREFPVPGIFHFFVVLKQIGIEDRYLEGIMMLVMMMVMIQLVAHKMI